MISAVNMDADETITASNKQGARILPPPKLRAAATKEPLVHCGQLGSAPDMKKIGTQFN
jgi:hypothetical protein